MALKTVSPSSKDRQFWNRRTEVGGAPEPAAEPAPDASPSAPSPHGSGHAKKEPSPKALRTADEIKELARSEEAFKSFLGEDDPFAHGFRRTIQYIRARRHEFTNDDDFAAVVSKFVDQYPTSVRQVDPEYWAGMKAARDSFSSLPKTFLGGA